ncbi:Oligosaccharyltransferase subunit Ribophorin II-domain-containing protein [Microdochium trichocladiopsis]|uniref:Oligosaccharyltransferase subunit Ribophorin II-domain-containing protein n=1 Tax=Microdochium trichocladiopsis TaxID=1682393 RepID=A0A9P8Y2D1_9PEZI|nr:Oligosaccharyltransferase subunit Ribophorin II-domain-containing protein [Microdochium trichocladiopsis]KAH7027618.1 Oligosaccharyltransferase subunit Ribophorin II-domain-containing protein [Microdochium trichocladiopsis]
MRFLNALVLVAAGTASAASSWGFDDATLTVGSRKAGDAAAGPAIKEKFNQKSPLTSSVPFGTGETLKVTLTAQEKGKGKRPHQAFLILREATTGVEAPFPLTVKDNGKATVEIKQTDLPIQHLTSTENLSASLVLASFGSSQGFNSPVFDIAVKHDPTAKVAKYEKPLRYGKLAEIHHIFRADPKSPPKIISLVFVLAVLATIPAVLIGWIALGANVDHLSKALSAAPISHAVFFGSIIAMEGVFFLYYVSWTLFQVLPVIALVGTATFLSGTKALGEVQSRRLAGER